MVGGPIDVAAGEYHNGLFSSSSHMMMTLDKVQDDNKGQQKNVDIEGDCNQSAENEADGE